MEFFTDYENYKETDTKLKAKQIEKPSSLKKFTDEEETIEFFFISLIIA